MNSFSLVSLVSACLLLQPSQAAPAIDFANQLCKPEWSVQYVPTANDCTKSGDIKNAVNGKIECPANFGCCHCSVMRCGSASNPNCAGLICNGDSSCYGAGLIQIFGPATGASVDCNGDLGCMQTKIVGNNINEVKCSGDGACAFTDMQLTCVSTGCPIGCFGDNSCEGNQNNWPSPTFFNVANSRGLTCSHQSCRYAYFSLMSDVGGDIFCQAISSCQSAGIKMVNTKSLQCNGPSSCQEASITIVNPDPNFYVNCGSAKACFGLMLRVHVTDPAITDFKQISCNGPSSCEGMRVVVSTVPPNKEFTFGPVQCNGPRACSTAYFGLGPNVKARSCLCGGSAFDAPCKGVIGITCQ